MKDRKSVVNLLIIPFLILFGCAKKEVLIYPQFTPIPPPKKVTAETLVEKISFPEVKTVKAEVRGSIQKNGEPKGTFSGALIYNHPDRIYARIFGPFGFTFMETFFDKGTLQVFVPPRDILYSGSVAFDRLLPDYDNLLNSMKMLEEMDNMYVLYIIGTTQSVELKPPFAQGGSNLILKAKYFFSKTDLSLNAVEFYAGGEKQVRIEVYRTEGPVPSDIGIRIKDTFFHLELKDIAINKTFRDDYFKPLEASQTLPLSRFLHDFAPKR